MRRRVTKKRQLKKSWFKSQLRVRLWGLRYRSSTYGGQLRRRCRQNVSVVVMKQIVDVELLAKFEEMIFNGEGT